MEHFSMKTASRGITAAFLGLITLPTYALFVNKDYNYSWVIFSILFFGVFLGLKQFNTFKIKSLSKKGSFSGLHIILWVMEDVSLLILINIVVMSVITLIMSKTGIETKNLLAQDVAANLLLYTILGVVLDFLSSWSELISLSSSYQRD